MLINILDTTILTWSQDSTDGGVPRSITKERDQESIYFINVQQHFMYLKCLNNSKSRNSKRSTLEQPKSTNFTDFT